LVREDAVLAAVMTDKATVEIPSPVEGEVVWLGAEIGEPVAVGSPLIRIRTAGEGEAHEEAEAEAPPAAKPEPVAPPAQKAAPREEPAPALTASLPSTAPVPVAPAAPRAKGEKPIASPAVRQRAREAGVDLRQVAGSG